MTCVESQTLSIEWVEKSSFRRTQVRNTDSTRKIEQLPPAMHRDPGALAFHNDVFCEMVQPFCDMALRKVEERDGRDGTSSAIRRKKDVRKNYRIGCKTDSTYRARGTKACELRDAVRSKFCPRDISVRVGEGESWWE